MTINLDQIQSILQTEDVEGLLALGAPQDEYAEEARQILISLNAAPENISQEGILAIVQQIWNKYFGPFSDQEINSRLSVLTRLAAKLFARER